MNEGLKQLAKNYCSNNSDTFPCNILLWVGVGIMVVCAYSVFKYRKDIVEGWLKAFNENSLVSKIGQISLTASLITLISSLSLVVINEDLANLIFPYAGYFLIGTIPYLLINYKKVFKFLKESYNENNK